MLDLYHASKASSLQAVNGNERRMSAGRPGIYIDAPDEQFRWNLRRAALDQRATVRTLVTQILTEWLTVHGYLGNAEERDIEGAGS